MSLLKFTKQVFLLTCAINVVYRQLRLSVIILNPEDYLLVLRYQQLPG